MLVIIKMLVKTASMTSACSLILHLVLVLTCVNVSQGLQQVILLEDEGLVMLRWCHQCVHCLPAAPFTVGETGVKLVHGYR